MAVMSYSQHECNLHLKDTSGLPRLAPNASWTKKSCRLIRKFFLLNPRHQLCKRLFRNLSAIKAERKRHATGPYFFVIHPLSTFNSILKVMFFALWMFALVFEPYEMFTLHPLYWQQWQSSLSPFRLVLIILFFNIGYFDKMTGAIVMEPKKITCRYLRTYFVFDLLASTHLAVPAFGFFTNDEETLSDCVRVAYVTRILASCVRIGSLLDSLNQGLANIRWNKAARAVTIHMIKTYLYVHTWAFIMYCVPRLYYVLAKDGIYPNRSWMTQAKARKRRLNIETFDIFEYTECFLMAFCYFFGLTYMYEITETVEQMCFCTSSFCGRLYTLFLLADILNLLGIVGVSESMYESRMSIMRQYMVEQDLPESIRQRIFRFCNFKFQGRYFKEKRILNTLSENLRTEIFLFSARNMTQKVDIFKKLPNFTLGAMIASMRSETFSSKDLIIKIGSTAEDIYFINSGTVAVVNSTGAELCHLEDGEVFGTSCLFFKTQVFAVVAVETTEVFIIGKDQLLTFFRPHPQVMIGFLQKTKLKLDSLKILDDRAVADSIDILSELQKGRILERFIKRMHAD